mgnify:CR=1 FL=1
MIKKMNNKLIFFASAVILAGSFLLAHLPREPGSQAPSYIAGVACLEDRESSLTIDDVQALQYRFEVQDSATIHKHSTPSAWWIRFTLDPLPGTGGDRYLTVRNTNLEHITLYFPGNPPIQAGKSRPITRDETHTRSWNIPVPPSVTSDDPVFMRIQSTSVTYAKLALVSSSELITATMRESILYGCFFGILVAVFFVNLFSFIIIKNRNFIIYLGYLGSLILFLIDTQGFLHILPLPFALTNCITWVALFGLGLFMILFAKQYLSLKTRYPTINRILNAALAVFALQTAIGLFGPDIVGARIAYITGFLVPLIIIFAAAKSYADGFTYTRFYLLAWSFFVSGTLVWSTASMLETQIPANYFFLIGTSLDSLLFTLSIFDQIRTELYEKELLSARENYYIDLSRTDALTGLYNRRYLTETVKRLEANNELAAGSSLLMIDLDNFKEINDTWGHLAGDMLLTRLGNKIKKHIRKTDFACRYGGDEFLLLLPGASTDVARNIAEAIRKEILEDVQLSDSGDPIPYTVSIGITSNRPDDSFDGLFLRADAALYQAKKTGRNRISLL